jgi:predicted GIY-YIG superfamily endonuclease
MSIAYLVIRILCLCLKIEKKYFVFLIQEEMSSDKTNIYILQCRSGKFYIGKSKNPQKRFEEHVKGGGSSWTSLYKPSQLLKVIPNASPFDEDKYVKEYMAKYGIENVRGGSYVEKELDDVQLEMLQREIRGATDVCSRCGRKGHFVANCYATKDVKGNELESEYETDDSDEDDNDECDRCGREGHYASSCYAKKDVNGESIDSEDDYDSD